MCDLYFRQRDTKKISSDFKCFLEDCLKGLPALTFINHVNQTLTLRNPTELLDSVSVMSFFSRKSVPLQSAVQSWSLRSHLVSLSTSASRLSAMRCEVAQLRECVARQAQRKDERSKEKREGLELIRKEESAIGEADVCLKKTDEEIRTYDEEIALMEADIANLKVEIEKTYDPSMVEEIKRTIQMSERRMLDAEIDYSTAKKKIEILEGQLGKKKNLLKSKCNLENTIKKHNDDLEEKICTARKEIEERSSSKKPLNSNINEEDLTTNEKTDQNFNEESFNTPLKSKSNLQFGSQLRFAIPNLGSAYRTPLRTAARMHMESPSFSPTYELAEIEHGCNIYLLKMPF